MNRVNLILNHNLFQRTLQRICILEETRIFCGHDMEHLLSVARIMMIENLTNHYGFDQELIYSAALLHDIGRAAEYEQGVSHAEAGAILAETILQDCKFSQEETAFIKNAIQNHNKRTDSLNLFYQLLKRADQLSRNCFTCSAKEVCKWPYEKMNQTITL